MNKIFSILCMLLISATTNAGAENAPSLEHLKEWMQGSFNSARQAEKDDTFFNIHLYMKESWQGETESTYLYVEQAAADYLDKPYRQRVYELKQLSGNEFESVVYTFDDPQEHAGDWKKERPLEGLLPADLSIRKGCSVFLKWDASTQSYFGSTHEKDCESTLRGATYATSSVRIFSDRIESWDRGYDADDNQVWGSESEGYVFNRQ